jgi:hypothetical protein
MHCKRKARKATCWTCGCPRCLMMRLYYRAFVPVRIKLADLWWRLRDPEGYESIPLSSDGPCAAMAAVVVAPL